MRPLDITDLSFEIIWEYYFNDKCLPSSLFVKLTERLDTVDRPENWVSRVSQENLTAQIEKLDEALQKDGEQVLNYMPLFGLPFAVKDNIDAKDISFHGGWRAYLTSQLI